MPKHYDDDDDQPHSGSGDREISLGTGTVLAIFLALALVCSLFFGLGYSMGRKSAPSASLASASSSLIPGSSARRSPTGSASEDAMPPDNQIAQPFGQDAPVRTSAHIASTQTRDRTAPNKPSPNAALPPAPAAVSIDPATESFVQVAAVSRKEDADLLLAALKRRGYAGIIRQQTQDKLLHIQVGPFPSKKDAEAMRQRLITDGYNPILK